MGRRRLTPQEKKRLSLGRDTPLSAKYPKAFRKHWPRKKAAAERAFRHAQRQSLAVGDEDLAIRREEIRKWPQARLGEVIATRAQRRAKLQRTPRKSAAARARRARRRSRLGGDGRSSMRSGPARRPSRKETDLHAVKVAITRFVDDAQPGWVECRLIDAQGNAWRFIEKVPVVTTEDLDATSAYPCLGVIACQIVRKRVDANANEIITIDTGAPWGIASITGQTCFEVHLEQLTGLG